MSMLESALSVDLGRALDEGPWGAYQKRVLVLAALAFGVDGLANQVLGLAIPSLMHDWSASRQSFAPVAALGLIGVGFGAAFGGVLGDRFGRRTGLIASVLLFGLMTSATALVNHIPSLLCLRLLAGLGIGGAIPNGAALIAEFTPLRSRSIAIALGMVFIPVGGLLAGISASYVLPSFGWRGLFLVAGIFPVALASMFVFVLPESPRFLARRRAYYAKLIVLLRRCGQTFEVGVVFADDSHAQRKNRLNVLFGAGMLMNTLALWTAFFFCLLASYSLFSWVPTMLAGQGFGLSKTSIGITAFNLGGVIGGVTGGWLMGQLGSRVSVIGLAAGASLGALGLGLLSVDPVHGLARVIGTLVLEGFFIAGLHNGLYTLATFIYPPFVRATGVGAAAAVGRIGAVLSSFTGVITLELGGASSYFIVIAATVAMSLLGVVMIRHHIPSSRSSSESRQVVRA
jgi:MFS transporter, AAHS family, 4-hydroxybenzoate transporter